MITLILSCADIGTEYCCDSCHSAEWLEGADLCCVERDGVAFEVCCVGAQHVQQMTRSQIVQALRLRRARRKASNE